MGLKIYFVRHGQTASSLENQFCGDLDSELTDDGAQMAQSLAQAYSSLPWKAVFSSPMRRTIATAKPLCDAVGLKIQLRDGLKEIAYGKWEGRSPEEVNHEFHDEYIRWLADPAWNSPTGGEKGIDIARRSSQVLEEIDHKYSTGNILVVSHKATIRIMLCSLLGIDVGRYRDRLGMPVGSVSVVEFAPNGPLLQNLGDRCHLDERLRLLPGT